MTTDGGHEGDRYAGRVRYYELDPKPIDDLSFYRERLLASPAARVLELGCGSGRILVELAKGGAVIHGVDRSPSMLACAQGKLDEAGIGRDRACLTSGDITALDLGRRFDWIIAPFRVLQALETAAAVDGLLGSIRRHLEPHGQAILNAFRPILPREAMRRGEWLCQEEALDWERTLDGGERITGSHRRARMDTERLVLYPELIYRRYQRGEQVEELVAPIVMRCFYPSDLIGLIDAAGFRLTGCWGGYDGEPYGEGPELVVQFGLDR